MVMKIPIVRIAIAGVVALAVASQPRTVEAAELKILCSAGIQAVMEELVPQFERAAQQKVAIRYGVSADLAREIDAGEYFDLAILAAPSIDNLIKRGKILEDSRRTLARSGVALMIRAGGAKPDVRTTEAFKHALLGSRSIAYVKEGASGVFFVEVLQKLNLAEALKSKVKPLATNHDVAASVARGDTELGVLPVSEILPVPGVEVLGTFPSDLRGYVLIVAGVGSNAKQGLLADEFVKFVTAPAASTVLEKYGMEGE
jgi:molybdate transport system substrate-binding protein